MNRFLRFSPLALLSAVLGLLMPALALAATDIANSPLSNASANDVKPNVLLILDDSLSMNSEYMPDSVDNENDKRCWGYNGYNRIFFNPAVTYDPPVDASGNSFANASFTGAKTDGFDSGSTSKNLSDTDNLSTPTTTTSTVISTETVGPTVCGKKNDSACSTQDSSTSSGSTEDPSTGLETTTVTSYTNKVRGNAPGKTCGNSSNSCTIRATKTVTAEKTGRFYWATLNSDQSNDCTDSHYSVVQDPAALTSAQKQNYANWYSYYRTRLLMARTATGKAFEDIDDDFRVGYAQINQLKNSVSDATFLPVGEFDATQKASFYEKLYEAPLGTYTPLRAALSRAGQYFAKKAYGQGSSDPMEYSCQRNFAILTTDGYWNTQVEDTSGSDRFGPYALDNSTTVGNQDAGAARPQKDDWKRQSGNSACSTTTSNLSGNSGSGEGKVGGAGCGNTLADVAYYYYNTDLRTDTLANCTGALGASVCSNNPGNVAGFNEPQRMYTYTVGLGVDGRLAYSNDYDSTTDSNNDFFKIKQGTKTWPNPIEWTGAERIDDLWHAAVNGGGKYYNTNNADTLADGLSNALRSVAAEVGSAAAAATSNLEPVADEDNFVYLAKYKTVDWTGELERYTIDATTGAISASPQWDSQQGLDNLAPGNRNLYYYDASVAATKLRAFVYGDDMAAGVKALFDGKGELMSQWGSLSAADQAIANDGANLVQFLRGETTNEGRAFRDREHVLGDIVHGTPVYVKAPPFAYGDSGYASFKTTNAGRAATIYVAANDGMLHAFNADTGAERWAYIPTMIMPQLYRLADQDYAANHRYYVDGAPIVADIYTGGSWKTILVGGLGAGGRGYFALDVTDPAAPKALWEFTDDDLGYGFGNPVVTKVDGTWVVAFSSGYNNVSPGDGQGHLFVRNAYTGAEVTTIDTGVGSAVQPSGLGKINAWVESETDNTAERFYGGDLLGNVWRMDPSSTAAVLVAQTTAGDGTPQPITVKPELAEIEIGNNSYAIVMVATGRYLGLSDLDDTTGQSIYAFKDDLTAASGLGPLRDASMIEQTLEAATINGVSGLTITDNPVNWSTDDGWYVDLLSAGERVNVDMQFQFNVLTVASNIPATDACVSGGRSLLYYLDIYNGSSLASADGLVAQPLGNALAAGVKTVRLANGQIVTIATLANGALRTVSAPSPSAGASQVRRTSWRELVDE